MIIWRDVSNKKELDAFLEYFHTLKQSEREEITIEMLEYLNDYKGFTQLGLDAVDKLAKKNEAIAKQLRKPKRMRRLQSR